MLIKSISGIRGTIGGASGDNLTPIDVVKFTSGYCQWIKSFAENPKIVIGRDARPTGESISKILAETAISMGVSIMDLGLSTTPTVEMAVRTEHADGGIIITASHNPIEWNALKLLNNEGEFISKEQGKIVLENAESRQNYVSWDKKGTFIVPNYSIDRHIKDILNHPLVDIEKIKESNFHVIIDAVNSSGGISIPPLLDALNVKYKKLHCDPTGIFPHNPEPLPENIQEICDGMRKGVFDLGIVVDPDVDRLALVCENGEPFGEEYTLVAISDYVLSKKKGITVSNLSSSLALKDVTLRNGGSYFSSAVGEVNVVKKMKEVKAVIGGEGNGGIILPTLHYGRDALAGVALFLSYLANTKLKASELRQTYPNYFLIKDKVVLDSGMDSDALFRKITAEYSNFEIDYTDGVKIILEKEWIQLRKSNTEPIIRIFAESSFEKTAKKHIENVKKIMFYSE